MTEANTDAARQAAGLAKREEKQLSTVQKQQQERIRWVEAALPRIVASLQNDEKLGRQFMMDMVTAVRLNPDLARCTEESFLGGMMEAAGSRLRVNQKAFEHCWLLPFKNTKRGIYEAQFILGYRGMITIAGRSGITVRAETIYEEDRWDVRFGLNEALEHQPMRDNRGRPVLDVARRGNPVAHYAILRSTTGGVAWRIMSHEDVLKAREDSASWKSGKPDAPWRTNEGPMCLKTIVRRTFPYATTESPELAMAFAADDRVITYNEKHDVLMVGDEPLTPDSDIVAEVVTPEPGPQTQAKNPKRGQATVTRTTGEAVDDAAKKARLTAALGKLTEVHSKEGAAGALRMVTGRGDVTVVNASVEELEQAAAVSPEQVAEWQQDQAAEKEGK